MLLKVKRNFWISSPKLYGRQDVSNEKMCSILENLIKHQGGFNVSKSEEELGHLLS